MEGGRERGREGGRQSAPDGVDGLRMGDGNTDSRQREYFVCGLCLTNQLNIYKPMQIPTLLSPSFACNNVQ